MLRFSKIPVICWDISYQQCSQVRKDCVGHQMVEWCYIIVKAAVTLSQGWWAIKKQSAAVPGFRSTIHMWVVVFFFYLLIRQSWWAASSSSAWSWSLCRRERLQLKSTAKSLSSPLATGTGEEDAEGCCTGRTVSCAAGFTPSALSTMWTMVSL